MIRLANQIFLLLHHLHSLRFAVWHAVAFLLSAASLHLLLYLHLSNEKYHWFFSFFAIILFQKRFYLMLFPTVCLTWMKQVHFQWQTVIWFCHSLAIRWQHNLPWVTLTIIFLNWNEPVFFQRHCHRIVAFTDLLFDRMSPSPRSYSLCSSIYTLLYMKSMLFYWGTQSATLSRVHVPQNASWETVSIGQRYVEM